MDGSLLAYQMITGAGKLVYRLYSNWGRDLTPKALTDKDTDI
jgi:hypothetical protein